MWRDFWNILALTFFVAFLLAIPPIGLFTRFSTTTEFNMTLQSPTTGESFLGFNGTLTLSGLGAPSVGNEVTATVSIYKVPNGAYSATFQSGIVTLEGAYLAGQTTSEGFPKLVTFSLEPSGGHWSGSAQVEYFEANPVGKASPLGINFTLYELTISTPKTGVNTISSKLVVVPPLIVISDTNSTTLADSNAVTIGLTFIIIMLACIELRHGNEGHYKAYCQEDDEKEPEAYAGTY